MIWYRDNFYLGEGIENGKRDRGSKKKVGHGQGENENVPEIRYQPSAWQRQAWFGKINKFAL